MLLGGQSIPVSGESPGQKIGVKDDGPGLPYGRNDPGARLSLAEKYLIAFRDAPTADWHAPHCHLVYRGLGLPVVNALSSAFRVESRGDGTLWTIAYMGGVADGTARPVATSRSGSGTRFRAALDQAIFHDATAPLPELRAIFLEVAHPIPDRRSVSTVSDSVRMAGLPTLR